MPSLDPDVNDSLVLEDRLTWNFEERRINGTNILGLIVVSLVWIKTKQLHIRGRATR
jgi:hypothetical protein